jgi:hypothetical protein
MQPPDTLRAMRRMILTISTVAAAATAAAGASITTKPPKAVLTSAHQQADIAACLAERLEYLAPASSLPASAGGVRLQFASMGKVFTDILISAGDPRRVEVRGVYTGKVKRKISECL